MTRIFVGLCELDFSYADFLETERDLFQNWSGVNQQTLYGIECDAKSFGETEVDPILWTKMGGS